MAEYGRHLLLITLLAALCSKTSSSRPEVSPQQLQDPRKLHAGYWLKVAARHINAKPSPADDAACLKHYGQQYLDRWRSLQDTYCNTSTSGLAGSHVQCWAHPEADLSTCYIQDLLLTSTSAFLGGSSSHPHSSQLPQPAAGSIRLACNRTADPRTFLRGRLQSNEGSRAWLVTAPIFQPPGSQLQGLCTGMHTVPHPVLFLLRVDPQNAFHDLETVVSVFSALAVLRLDPRLLRHGMEVVIADDRLEGYFTAIWHRLSWPHLLRVLRTQPYPDNTCFSKAILAPYTAHAQSLLTYKAGAADEVLCESVVLQAVSRWLRYLFRELLPLSQLQKLSSPGNSRQHSRPRSTASGDQQQADDSSEGVGSESTSSSSSSSSVWQGLVAARAGSCFKGLAPLSPSPTQSAKPLEQLNLVWLSRLRFEQQHAAELTQWQKARALTQQQQEELVLGLQQAVLQWNAQTCATPQQKGCKARDVMYSLQVAELSELSFYPDQLSLMMRAGVLVGVHGAGLANQVYMQPRAGAVVEVWYGMEGNTHYHNMAHMLGHAYFNVQCEEGKLDVAAVVSKVSAAMDEAAARHAAAAAAAVASRQSWWWRKQRSGTP